MAKARRIETIHAPIIIIGTGFAGVCMGIQLQKAGIQDFLILEKSSDTGGTWRDNTYPGAACDISSHMYSYSFEPNPNWSRMYSPQQEIYAYIGHCIEKYGLNDKIRYYTEVTGGTFQQEEGLWHLNTASGDKIITPILINGMGPLNRACFPNIPGLDTFKGKTFHSSHWDHDYDLRGKKVAVIGTGASAIQVVPAIAPIVGSLQVFQRTPPWILPKPDRDMTAPEKRLFRLLPFSQWSLRTLIYWISEVTVIGTVIDPRLTKWLEKYALRFLAKSVPDDELRKKLTPDYAIGCKRILLSNDYYPAINRKNVELYTTGIERVDAKGLVMKDGSRNDVDAIIYCTGFEAAEYPKEFVVKGRYGQSLGEVWKDGPEAYKGISVTGFPNMFLIIGPNTGLGHNSMIFMIEAQVHYIVACIKAMRKEDTRILDVKDAAQQDYNEEIQKRLAKTVWNTGCKSWYKTASGKNTTVWPGFTFEYWQRTRKIKKQDYEWVS